MKKCISILLVLFISGFATLNGKKIRTIILDKPTNKTIRFSISSADYSAPMYRKSKANVKLMLYKFHNGKKEFVWEEMVDEGSLKNYSNKSNGLYREVCVYNVYDKKETVAAYYEVTYVSKGETMSYIKGVPLSPGASIDSLRIVM